MIGDFNQSDFNTTHSNDVYAGAVLSGSGDFTGKASMQMAAKAVLSGDGALSGKLSMEAELAGIVAGEAGLTANANIVFAAIGTVAGVGDFIAKANVVFAAAGILPGTGTLAAQANVLYAAAGLLSAEGVFAGSASMIFAAIPETILGEVTMQASISRELRLAGEIHVESAFEADASQYRVETIAFEGDFEPGDIIIFDSKKKTVTLNGVNAFQHMSGDFVMIAPGGNTIVYADAESSRTVRIRVTHRDKYLY